MLPSLTAGEVQPELQVQGAHRGKWLQHVRLPPLEARRQADVRLPERTGETTAGSQGPAEAPVHPLPAHAPIVDADPELCLASGWLAGLLPRCRCSRGSNQFIIINIILLLFHPATYTMYICCSL